MSQPLHIGVVARHLHAGSGFGAVNRGLVEGLSKLKTPHRITVFTTKPPKPRPDSLEWQILPCPEERFKLFRWDQTVIPKAAKQAGVDVIHWLHQTGSIRKAAKRTVITVCDAIPWQEAAYTADRRMRFYARVDKRAIRRADQLITISEYSKQQIVKTLKVPANRVSVTYLAPDGSAGRPPRPNSVSGNYILFVGGSEVRKNGSRLIRAYAHSMLALPLVVIGDLSHNAINDDLESQIAELPEAVRNRIITPGRVSSDELASLYAHARLFAFPSMSEGFGLPPLEAMRYGTPVLTSNVSSLPEVVGKAAILVDPRDTPAITRGLQRLAKDADLRGRLSEEGRAQAKLFNWQRTAEETLAVYEQVARK